MKATRYEGGELRRVLASMATDTTVCSRIASQWSDGGLFDTPWANLVGQWCIEHLQKYGKPPNGQLKGIFQDWTHETKAPDKTVELIEKFLISVSDSYSDEPPQSSDYLLDVAGRYFNKIRLRKMVDQVEDQLDGNKVAEAYDSAVRIAKVELGVGAMVKPAEDYDAWRKAFDEERMKQLIHYPGGLDRFLGRWLTRGRFYCFMGPDKSGKSMWLLDASYRAIRDRHRVAYFEVGDMGQDDVLIRLGQRASGLPDRPCRVKWPKKIDREGVVDYERRIFEEGLTPQQAYKSFTKACRGKDLFRLSSHPNSSIDVDGVRSILSDWERDGWVPDVISIDYADILAEPKRRGEVNEQIDFQWKQLRRMSQELHCLTLTATQSSALAYSAKTKYLSRKHFSGRKTKLAHVNGMIGINVSPEDKEKGVTRINWIVKREGKYDERRAVPVAGCFEVANPAMKSWEN